MSSFDDAEDAVAQVCRWSVRLASCAMLLIGRVGAAVNLDDNLPFAADEVGEYGSMGICRANLWPPSWRLRVHSTISTSADDRFRAQSP